MFLTVSSLWRQSPHGRGLTDQDLELNWEPSCDPATLPDWVGLFDSNPSTSGQWCNSQYFYMKVCAQIAAKIHTFITSETDSDGPDNLGGPVLTILTLGTWRLGHKDYVASITVELHLSKCQLSDQLGPLGKFVKNSTKLTCLEITDLWIKYNTVLWLFELQSDVVKKFRCRYIL